MMNTLLQLSIVSWNRYTTTNKIPFKYGSLSNPKCGRRGLDIKTKIWFDAVHNISITRDKLHFFGKREDASIMIDRKGKRRLYCIIARMIISLIYQVTGEKYLSMASKFGGDWWSYTYPINYFVDYLFENYFKKIFG